MIIHWYCLDDFISDFLAVRDNFSREGLTLLFEYYDSIGEPIEFDPIAMCCDWVEYASPYEAIVDIQDADYIKNQNNEYVLLLCQGYTEDQALEELLGAPVLWDGKNCFLVGV
tara:strand:+ start:833 stop:1171 length:339 start_codon:yes stop_codon:yes gene_type:complete